MTSTAMWKESEYMLELAKLVIRNRDEVRHVIVGEVLFLEEHETKPKAEARTYNLINHPIGYYTDKRWCIVFYMQNIFYMSNNQKAILMLHELMHIPAIGERLIDHNVKDFINILRMDVDWSLPGKEVIDILND